MSAKNYYGRKAYQKAIKQGLSKDEAKQASNSVKAKIDKQYQSAGKVQPTKSNVGYDDRGYDFDSDLNGNGTDWHTAEDL